jgi:hypothetical protein
MGIDPLCREYRLPQRNIEHPVRWDRGRRKRSDALDISCGEGLFQFRHAHMPVESGSQLGIWHGKASKDLRVQGKRDVLRLGLQ